METIKVRVTHEWLEGKLVEKIEEKIEAIIFNDENGKHIISLDDLSFLTSISLTSLKNYIRNNHILHYHISSKWFVAIEDFFEHGKRILE